MKIQGLHSAAQRGFTLIELVSVIAVIAILAGAIGFSIKGTADGLNLRAGQRVLVSTFNAARSVAILQNCAARVVICNDPNDPRYLAYLGILVQNPENDDEWKALDSGVRFPQGVYLIPDIGGNTSESLLSGADMMRARSLYNGRVLSMPNDFPFFDYRSGISEAENNALNWIYYEFSSTGRPEHQDGNRFIIGIAAGHGRGQPVFSDPGAAIGIKIRRYGNLSPLNQIGEFILPPIPDEEEG